MLAGGVTNIRSKYPRIECFGKRHPNFLIAKSPSFEVEDGIRRILGYLV